MRKKRESWKLTIENTIEQKVTERYADQPTISDIVEALNIAKYLLDSPQITRMEITKGTANDNK